MADNNPFNVNPGSTGGMYRVNFGDGTFREVTYDELVGAAANLRKQEKGSYEIVDLTDPEAIMSATDGRHYRVNFSDGTSRDVSSADLAGGYDKLGQMDTNDYKVQTVYGNVDDVIKSRSTAPEGTGTYWWVKENGEEKMYDQDEYNALMSRYTDKPFNSVAAIADARRQGLEVIAAHRDDDRKISDSIYAARYQVTIPGQEPKVMSAADFASQRSSIYADNPKAEVVKFWNYRPEAKEDGNAKYFVYRTGAEEPEEWTRKELDEQYADLKAQDPGVQVIGVVGDDYKQQQYEHAKKMYLDFMDVNGETIAKLDKELRALKSNLYSGTISRNKDEVDEWTRKLNEKTKVYNALTAQRNKLFGDYESTEIATQQRKTYAETYKDLAKRYGDKVLFSQEDVQGATMGPHEKLTSWDITNYESASGHYRSAARTWEAPSVADDNSFVKNMLSGAKDVASTSDFWTMGLTGLVDSGKAVNIIRDLKAKLRAQGKSVDDISPEEIDKNLTRSEAAFLKAWMADAAAQAGRALLEGDELTDEQKQQILGKGYTAGQTAAQSAVFMAQFLLTGNAAGALGASVESKVASKAATQGIKKASNGLLRWVARALSEGNEAAIRAVGMKAGKLGKNVIAKATRPLSKVYKYGVRPVTQGLVHTVMQPATYKEMLTQVANAELSSDIVNYGQVIWQSALDSMIENWSESVGIGIEDAMMGLLKYGGKMGGKVLKLGDKLKLGEMTPAQWGKFIVESGPVKLMHEAGFNGFLSEMGEEWLGNAARVLVNEIGQARYDRIYPDEDRKFEYGMTREDFADWTKFESQFDMAASFAPMSLIGLGSTSVAAYKQKLDWADSVEEMKRILPEVGGITTEEANALFNTRQTREQLKEKLRPIVKHVLEKAKRGDQNAIDNVYSILKFAQQSELGDVVMEAQQYYAQQQSTAMEDEIRASLGASGADDVRGTFYNNVPVKGKDGKTTYAQQVTVMTARDGEWYVIDQGGSQYLLKKTDGSASKAMSKKEYADLLSRGRITEQSKDKDVYLTGKVKERADALEQQRIAKEKEAKKKALVERLDSDPTVDFGGGNVGQVTEIRPEGLVVTFGNDVEMDGRVSRQHLLSYEKVGNAVGIDQIVLTQQEQDRAKAKQAKEDLELKHRLNRMADGKSFVIGDKVYKFRQINSINHDEQTGDTFFNIQVDDAEGNNTSVQIEKAYFEDQMKVEESTGIQEAVAAERVITDERLNDERPRDFRGNLLPLEDDGSVDSQALWDKDKEAFLRWNDARRGGDTTNSVNTLDQLIAAQEQAIAKTQQAYAKATVDQDFKTRDKLEQQMKDMQSDLDEYNRIRNEYAMNSEQMERDYQFQQRMDRNAHMRRLATTAEQRQGLMEERAQILSEYLGGVMAEDTKYQVCTAANVLDVITKDMESLDEAGKAVCAKNLQEITEALAEGINFTGFYLRSTDKIYFVNDYIPSLDEARTTAVHEYQHKITYETGVDIKLAQDVKREELAQAVQQISGTAFYNSKPIDELADEAISHCMEVVANNSNLSIEDALAQAGVTGKNLIKFIKNLENEQRESENNLFAARRNAPGRARFRATSGIDGADQGGESYGMGEQGSESSEGSETQNAYVDPELPGVTQEQAADVNKVLGGELETKGNPEPVRFSVTAQFEGAGLRLNKDDGNGNVVAMAPDGTVYSMDNPITAEDLMKIPNTAFGYMMKDAARIRPNMDPEWALKIWNKYALMLNAMLFKGSAAQGGFDNLAANWQWIAESVYKTVSINSDSQYSYSIDITRVCKKNEAVINGIAEEQRRRGYGITPGQIMDIYMQSIESGYQVPCPVCYVFSRYIRNGKYATIMINGQRKYGGDLVDPATLTPKQKEKAIRMWLARLKEVENQNKSKENAALIARANKDITELLGEIDEATGEVTRMGEFDRIARKITNADKLGITQEQVDRAMKKVQMMDTKYRAALNVVSQSSLDSWITQFAIYKTTNKNPDAVKVEVDGETQYWALYGDTYQGFPESAALDIRDTPEVLRHYPAIQRYRNSRGAAAGKEIHMVSNNDIGDMPLALGSQAATKNLAKPMEMSDEEWEALLKEEDGYLKGGVRNLYRQAVMAKSAAERKKILNAATKRFKAAHIYALQQTLRGGQRMWSWSDNIERLGPDVFINLLQEEILGGAVQSYSKQLEGIKHVASLGAYVNGSLMGYGNGYEEISADQLEEIDGRMYVKDGDVAIMNPELGVKVVKTPAYLNPQDGKYYVLRFDSTVGIEPYSKWGVDMDGNKVWHKGLFELNQELDKAGNIIVGMNDLHVRISMADDRIYFIIPWHSSGANTHILSQMYALLGVEYDVTKSQDFTKVQEEKRFKAAGDVIEESDNAEPDENAPVDGESVIPEEVVAFWEDHYSKPRYYEGYGNVAGKDFRCGIEGGIESGDAFGNLSEGQLRYRELRDAIFVGLKREAGKDKNGKTKYKRYPVDHPQYGDKEMYKEIMSDEFLSQAFNKVRAVVGGFMTSGDCKFIYPYEYWDEGSTFATADINGARYMEYCRRLGYKPKFCGKLSGPAEEDYGNFVDDKGYWKLLIDRRMYDVDGKFQDLTPVDISAFTPSLVDPVEIAKEFDVTKVADETGTNTIVDRAMAKEVERAGSPYEVDYDLDLTTALDVYTKANEDLAGFQDEARKGGLRAKAVDREQADAIALVNGISDMQAYIDEVNAYAGELGQSGMQGELAWARLTERYPGLQNLLDYGIIEESDDNADGSTIFKVNRSTLEEIRGGARFRTSKQLDEEYPNWQDNQTPTKGKKGHSTQVAGTLGTYTKVGGWIKENLPEDTTILDASSGMGLGTQALREMGFNVEDAEPYPSEERKAKGNTPTYSGPTAYQQMIDAGKKYDFIISNAVLNVIPEDWRNDVLRNMAAVLNDGGKLFINTRPAADVKAIKSRIELDSPTEVLVGTPDRINSYQKFYTVPELIDYVKGILGDGYTVVKANKANSGTDGLAAVVVTKSSGAARFKAVDAKVTSDDAAKVIVTEVDGRKESYARNSKYGVGKDMMGKVYFHKDYMDDILPDGMGAKVREIAEKNGIEYKALMYDPKKPELIRYDEAPDFDTAREPHPGRQQWADVSTMELVGKQRNEQQIWHHKWMWVKDDYQGFDVNESYEWSKQWLEKIANPSGWRGKWEDALAEAGLPTNSGAARFSAKKLEDVNKEYNERLKDGYRGVYDLGIPSQLLRDGGIDGEMRITGSALEHGRIKHEHDSDGKCHWTQKDMEDLPIKLSNAMCVIQSYKADLKNQYPMYLVILNETDPNGCNYAVAFHRFDIGDKHEWDARSAYGKEDTGLISFMESGTINSYSPDLLKWIEKKKIEISSRKGPNALSTREKLDSVANIIRKTESATFVDKKTAAAAKKQQDIEVAVTSYGEVIADLSGPNAAVVKRTIVDKYIPDALKENGVNYVLLEVANISKEDADAALEFVNSDNVKLAVVEQAQKNASSNWIAEHTNYWKKGGTELRFKVAPSIESVSFRAVEITPEVRAEMDTIEATARINGTYLKAPNGQDTKLNPEQWAMVRTKAFKDWFGDWENDPENASKVVDENGEPMVVYHGTMTQFNTFNQEESDSTNELGKGMYFSDSYSLASKYASIADNPDMDHEWRVLERFEQLGKEIGLELGYEDTFNNEYIGLYNKAYDDVMKEARIIPAFLNIRNPYRQLEKEIVEGEPWKSNDGIIDTGFAERHKNLDGNQYVVFSPNQIKSATDNNGNFDPNDPDIRFKATTKQDADYMAAVEAGDMEKAQAMVDAAAESSMADSQVRDAAGKLLHVYHGTKADKKFWVFDTYNKRSNGDLANVGSHFGPKGTAEEFSKDNLYDVYLNMKKVYEAPFDFFADNYNNAYLEVLVDLKNNCESEEAQKIFDRIYDIYPNLSTYNLDDISIAEEFDGDTVLEEMETRTTKSGMKYTGPRYLVEHRNAMVEIMRDMMEAEGFDGISYDNWYEGEFENKCYVALYPSQIKSADPVTYDDNGNVIPLSQRFNTAENDIRFRFIGTVGAERLDAMDKGTRMQNQVRAVEMEGEGKDAKTIKIATGWERGADGKWRYEQADGKLKPFLHGYYGSYKLSDLIDDKELFEAYPFLKDTEVTLNNRITSYAGNANYKDNEITLTKGSIVFKDNMAYDRWSQRRIWEESWAANDKAREAGVYDVDYKSESAIEKEYMKANGIKRKKDLTWEQSNEISRAAAKEFMKVAKNAKQLLDKETFAVWMSDHYPILSQEGGMTILHEIQHMVQSAEGFARGGSSSSIDPAYQEEYDRMVKEIAALKTYAEAKPLIEKANKFAKEHQIGVDGYQRLAGEVEARNVENRYGMSYKKRRETLASETETYGYDKPISREEQTVRFSVDKKASETVSPLDEDQPTVVSDASGAKVLKEIDNAIEKYRNLSNRTNTFIGDLAKAIGAKQHGSQSQYATFETINGSVITLRIANHNARVSTFDNNGEDNGISIVISSKGNELLQNDGTAHVNEYYYDGIKLRRAEGKPLVNILLSIKQCLYSGEYKDTTGLAEHEEVNKTLYRVTNKDDANYLMAYETNDTEAAMKMVEEAAKKAGYRYKAYHGTPNGGFTEFDNSHRYGEIYFTDNEYVANAYKNDYTGESPTVYSSFLRIHNPIRYDAKGKTHNDLTFDNKIEILMRKARENGNGGVIIKNIYDSPSGWSHDPAYLGTDYLVLDPSNIKSAEPFTYDDSGNIIPLSERFNPDSNDIRFSVRPATQAKRDGLEAVIGKDAVDTFATDVYGELPTSIQYEVTDRALLNGGSFTRAVYEVFSQMAEKDTLSDQEQQAVKIARDKLMVALADPEVSKNDVLWILYNEVARNLSEGDLLDRKHWQEVRRKLGQTKSVLGRRLTLDDIVEAANEASEDVDKHSKALADVMEELADIKKVADAQRGYDRITVGRLTDLVDLMIQAKVLDSATNKEIREILDSINEANGMKDIAPQVDKLYAAVLNGHIKRLEAGFEKVMKVKSRKVTSKKVTEQGTLDLTGQKFMDEFKAGMAMYSSNNGSIIASQELEDLIAEQVDYIASGLTEHERDLYAYTLAKKYIEQVTHYNSEVAAMERDIRGMEEQVKLGQMSMKDFNEFKAETEKAIISSRTDMAKGLASILQDLMDVTKASHSLAIDFLRKQQEHAGQILHNAKSDMQGIPDDEQRDDPTLVQRTVNGLAKTILAPLGTFDQMLRLFGQKSINGEGYLWNRFMRGWIDATGNEFERVQERFATIDKKVSEVFGSKMRWSDLYSWEKRSDLPTLEIEFQNGSRKTKKVLRQGQMLYIYLVNQMEDGRMKLRAMGISQDDVDKIEAALDPKAKTLGNYMVNEFLPDSRKDYNQVHKRVFGAEMDGIENYFPLKINRDSRVRKEDVATAGTQESIPSTITSNIIKRVRNTTAIDLNADAFSVLIEHIQNMEHWAAFAEWNRDINTLISSKKFKNQVKNMTSVYGSGEQLWKNFMNVTKIAAGTYEAKTTDLDKGVMAVASGVTAAKISLRVFTALKQFMSYPAYFAESNPLWLAKATATPWESWNWAMENLPVFRKRWKSRQAGDHVIKSVDDWRTKIMEKAALIGMTPNAAVDALTVSIGSYAIYKSKYDKYIRFGYSPDVADRKAKQDAVVLYNETQQSNEDAFMSSIQKDRSVMTAMFTVFRNSSMGYQRQLHDAFRNIAKQTPDRRKQAKSFMAEQAMREGLSAAQADKYASAMVNRQAMKDIVRVAIFGYGMQLAWNLGSYLPYLLFGDDDKTKKEFWDDVLKHSIFGGIEGLTGGSILSEVGNMKLHGESLKDYDPTLLPMAADMKSFYQHFDKDMVSGINELINLAVQVGIGVNPQTIEDFVFALMDAGNGDLGLAKETGFAVLRILQVPQSQIEQLYLDEVQASAQEAIGMTPVELAQRYAKYKLHRKAGIAEWMYSDPVKADELDKLSSRLVDKTVDRMSGIEIDRNFKILDEEAKEMAKEIENLRSKSKDGDEDAQKRLMEIYTAPDRSKLDRFTREKAEIKSMMKEVVQEKDREKALVVLEAAIRKREQLISDMAEPDGSDTYYVLRFHHLTDNLIPYMKLLDDQYKKEYKEGNGQYGNVATEMSGKIKEYENRSAELKVQIDEQKAALKKLERPGYKRATYWEKDMATVKAIRDKRDNLYEQKRQVDASLKEAKNELKLLSPVNYMPDYILDSPAYKVYLTEKTNGSFVKRRFVYKDIAEYEKKIEEGKVSPEEAKAHLRMLEIKHAKEMESRLSAYLGIDNSVMDEEDDGFEIPE